jgi:hypothetical protein
MEFEVETSASNNEVGGIIDCVATDVTGASEDFKFVFKLMAAGAAAASVFEVSSNGVFTQTLASKKDYSGSKVLSDGVATGFVEIAVATGEFLGGVVEYSIYVTDGTDFQSHAGSVAFVAVNKAGTVTSDIEETYGPAAEAEVATSGTLSDDFTITNGSGKITINCKANTSLTPSANYPVLKYSVMLHSANTITPL